jgi:hypothetical protein
MTTATVSLPPVTPAFARAVRELAMQIGWRNVAKSIAYGPTQNETVAPYTPARNGNEHKATPRRKGRKLWWLAYPAEYEMAARVEYDHKRHSYNCKLSTPFRWAQGCERRALDKTSERLSLYSKRECCGSPMGIMESWPVEGGHGEPLLAVYQCAVNAAHRQPACADAPIRKRRGVKLA